MVIINTRTYFQPEGHSELELPMRRKRKLWDPSAPEEIYICKYFWYFWYFSMFFFLFFSIFKISRHLKRLMFANILNISDIFQYFLKCIILSDCVGRICFQWKNLGQFLFIVILILTSLSSSSLLLYFVVVSWWWSWLSSLWRWWWWTWLSPLSSLLLSPMSWCQICEGLEHSRKRTFHNFHSQYVLTPFPNPPFHRFEKLDGIFKKLRNCNFHFGCQRMM